MSYKSVKYEIITETAKNGGVTCKIIEDGKKTYLYSKYSPEKNLINCEIYNTDYIILGLGLGYEAAEILRRTEGRVFIVDYDKRFYDIIKNEDTLKDFLDNDRLIFLFGDDIKNYHFENYYNIFALDKLVSLNYDFFKEVIELLKENRRNITIKKTIKKIICFEYTFVVNECADVFHKMGFEVVFLNLQGFSTLDDLYKSVLTENADILFTINYYEVVSAISKELNIYYISWIVDYPDYKVYSKKIKNDKEFIFNFEKITVDRLGKNDIYNMFYLPLAVASKKINKGVRESDFIADVSFLANIYVSELRKNFIPKLEKKYVDIIYEIIDKQNEFIDRDIIKNTVTEKLSEDIIINAGQSISCLEKECGSMKLKDIMTILMCREQSYIMRINFAKAFEKKFDFKLYGCDEWKRHISSVNKKVDYYTEMPDIFNRSKINLNITNTHFYSAIPLRVFDVLGAGGFLLTNYRESLFEYFKDGEDIAVFKSLEEALELADFYLKHNELRYKMIENAYEKIKKFHSYEDRIKEMFKMIF